MEANLVGSGRHGCQDDRGCEALDDEYKARATYRKVIEAFGPVRPFVNIVEAEDRHAEAIEATEAHLRAPGYDPADLLGAKGFSRIKGLADAVEAVYSSDDAKRRFEMARQVFIRFRALNAHSWNHR